MGWPFASSLRALLRPGEAFRSEPPAMGQAVWAMARIWLPLALIHALGTAWRALGAWRTLRIEGLPAGLLEGLGLDPLDLRDMLASLPPPPPFARLWPWLLIAAPLGVLGTWLHHAVWDHTGLWLLGGLKEKRGFRTSLLAEAEALRWAALGTLVGFLAWVPVLDKALAIPLLMLDGYLWLFRGFALAARHGCEAWRGMAATVLHAVLFGGFVLVVVLLALIAARMGA